MKTILEQPAKQRFIFRKSHHAVTDVAGRKDAVLAPQAAGAAAVIGDGNDGGKISDGALGAGVFVSAADDEFFEAAKERGKAGAAAESDDAEAAGKSLRFGFAFFHGELLTTPNRSFYKRIFPRSRKSRFLASLGMTRSRV